MIVSNSDPHSLLEASLMSTIIAFHWFKREFIDVKRISLKCNVSITSKETRKIPFRKPFLITCLNVLFSYDSMNENAWVMTFFSSNILFPPYNKSSKEILISILASLKYCFFQMHLFIHLPLLVPHHNTAYCVISGCSYTIQANASKMWILRTPSVILFQLLCF